MRLTAFAWNVYDGRRSSEVSSSPTLSSLSIVDLERRSWTNGNPGGEDRPKIPSLPVSQVYSSAHSYNTWNTTPWSPKNRSRAPHPLGTSTTLVSYRNDFCNLVGNASDTTSSSPGWCIWVFVTLYGRFSLAETLGP